MLVLRLSVCNVMAKGCILEQKLLLTPDSPSLYEVVYEKSIGNNTNDLDLCLEVV